MERHEVEELYYLAPMANLASISARGLLSHERAAKIPHVSIAMEEIQDRRARVMVPRGRRLHEYVNLYFCARNPMMYKRLDQRHDVCVLRVCHHVLDLPGVIVTDGNASGSYTKFEPAPSGLKSVDRALTHATYWNIGDQPERWRRAWAKCAEVLVPDGISVEFILGAYVCNAAGLERFEASGSQMAAAINGHLFFQ